MRFKIDSASLIVGGKFTVLLCFTLYLRAIFQVQAPGRLIFEGRFFGSYLDGLIYTWRGLLSEFYGIFFYSSCLRYGVE